MSISSVRHAVSLLVMVLATLAACAGAARAQSFPTKPITIVVGFGPGGTSDSILRLYAQKMSEILKTPVIIENKPGGNQSLAIQIVRQAKPDGYTLYGASGSALVQNPGIRNDLPYDPLKDFTLIGLVATIPALIVVNNDLPVRSIKELVSYAAAHPGDVNYASAGVGTAGHLAVELVMSMTGVKMTHIPYKSDVDMVREVMAGNVQMSVVTTLNSVSHVKSGKMRAIAITTERRVPYLPDVPSVTETDIKALSELSPHTFITLVGPVGMPPAVVAQLNEAINSASANPDVVTRVRNNFYAEPATTTPESFRQFVEKELIKWKRVGKNVKLTE